MLVQVQTHMFSLPFILETSSRLLHKVHYNLHWLQHIQASGHWGQGNAYEMYHKWTEGAHCPETLVRVAAWDMSAAAWGDPARSHEDTTETASPPLALKQSPTALHIACGLSVKAKTK